MDTIDYIFIGCMIIAVFCLVTILLQKIIPKEIMMKNSEASIKKGETIKFVVKNMGELVHEFNIATKEMHIKHQPEMLKMVAMEILLGDKIDMKKMKEVAKSDHSMAHSHSNSVLLEPKKTW